MSDWPRYHPDVARLRDIIWRANNGGIDGCAWCKLDGMAHEADCAAALEMDWPRVMPDGTSKPVSSCLWNNKPHEHGVSRLLFGKIALESCDSHPKNTLTCFNGDPSKCVGGPGKSGSNAF